MAPNHHPARRARPLLAVPAAAVAVGLAAATLAATPGAATAAVPGASSVTGLRGEITAEAPVYAVTGQGMSQDQAQGLADRLGIAPALEKSGAFSYVDAARYGKVPSRKGVTGTDEKGRRTVARRLDVEALKALDVMPEGEAMERARGILRLPKGFDAQPQVSHTQLTMADARGGTLGQFDLDTTVAFDFTLDGHRVVGTGNRNRVAFAADGTVLALNQSVRDVEQKGFVGIVGPDAAREQCDRLYGGQVDQLEPELVYSSPALRAAGSPELVLPHYACRPAPMVKQDRSALGRLVPAAPELTPEATLSASTDGVGVKAAVDVTGGTAPYAVQWSSSGAKLTARGDEVAYRLKGRGGIAPSEVLTATVTDANGVVTSVSATLDTAGDAVDAQGYGGEGGVLNVGIEQTVDEWQCAQDSAIGFKQEMAALGESTKFDWRGTNAWEKDFKRTTNGGIDDQFVDTVDAQWYTGHGNSGGFSFKNKSQSDEWIVPNDSRWGDNFNLEWMMLESCQVLRDTNGTNDYFQRWAPAFDGLHVLNGFHTNAQCVGGGTGRRFASYLHPTWWGRPALTVPQAWQAMANDLEPSGTVWRSISPARAGWVNNLGDKYWGQGTVGPDIPLSQQIGWVAVSGTV